MKGIHIDRTKVLLHALFWLAWIISFTMIQSIGEDASTWFVWLMYYLITLPVFIAHTYVITYWLIPETFFKGKYLLTILGVLLLLIFFSVIELIISNELVFKIFDPEMAFESGYLNLSNVLISGVGNHYVILVFLAIKVTRTWYLSANTKEKLVQTKLETDLEIYRYQLQPKLILFLIEELEMLSEKDPEKVSGMIVKISNFINQFIFEGKEDWIPLTLEVKLLESFLEIHDYALGDRLASNFAVSGKLQSYVVPPLLLLPVISRAIKMAYECNKRFENAVFIKAEKRYLLFSFTFWSEDSFQADDNEELEIIKKRLKFKYPGKHRLIENVDDNFREFSLEIYT